jgi:sigma-B regulation protein RsbU (phosphoserine phosphatase)
MPTASQRSQPREVAGLTDETRRRHGAASAHLEADRLRPILAPLAAFGGAIGFAVEDAVGRPVASVGRGTREVFAVPIDVAGAPAGRVIVRASTHPSPARVEAARAAAGTLAAALAALAEDTDPRVLEERTRIDAELALGRRLQLSFVQLAMPEIPGWAVASHYAAAREVGGDFFDLFVPRNRRGELALVCADVTGKGIAAALLMAFARPLIHAAIDHARRPALALERTNRILVEERRAALFITASCAYIDARTGGFVVANAGHEPPLILRADGRLEEVEASGVLLGAFARLGLVECRGELWPGDAMLLYTDGVTDARAPDGSRFGDDRLRALVLGATGTSVREVVDGIARAVRDFQAGEPPADDVTILALERGAMG